MEAVAKEIVVPKAMEETYRLITRCVLDGFFHTSSLPVLGPRGEALLSPVVEALWPDSEFTEPRPEAGEIIQHVFCAAPQSESKSFEEFIDAFRKEALDERSPFQETALIKGFDRKPVLLALASVLDRFNLTLPCFLCVLAVYILSSAYRLKLVIVGDDQETLSLAGKKG